MHIAVVFQHFSSPDQAASARHHALLGHWARRHRITLLTSPHGHASGSGRPPALPAGVDGLTIAAPYGNYMGPGRRALAFGRFATGAFATGLRLDRPDVILGVSTPLTAAAAAAAIGTLRGVPWVFDVKDLWPDFPVQMGAVPRTLRRPLYALERRLYRHAAHVVTLSPGMSEHVRRTAALTEDRVTTLYNGTDAALVDASAHADPVGLRRAHGLTGKRVVLYGGTFGRANNVPLLISVAERLGARGDAALVCVGHGHGDAALREAAGRLGGALVVPGAVARRDVFAWIRAADLALVSFVDIPVLGTTSPAKLFDALACGTPVVVMNDGWMRALVETENVGAYVPASAFDAPERIAALLDAPEALAHEGRRAEALYRRDAFGMFDRERHAEVYEAVFERVVAEPRARRA